MTNRPTLAVRPMLAAMALIAAVLSVAAGLPLGTRLTGVLSQFLFTDLFYGPVLSQLIVLVAGLAAFAIAVHRTLRPLAADGR
ncbi:hypothetical protein OHS33_34630 [Streptomyces sp. NBC_00536]|uniref:hypothetical protein n=1 Tax=Streptomyces sp. NBC_00536 TaxID=2975769 RepID=UPI002E80B9ED|nr:hypothetical protein [Streptomyces sp. NBC_00536]WUC83056.1 hypothetical protein OHS33_34630 [Streptomyces sp. NBC_00536]